MTRIVCDSREQARLVQPILDELMMEDRFKDIVVERCAMKYGDYLIESDGVTLLIERKSIADFVSSYAKGNLQEKLAHMRMENTRTMLLLEGTIKIKGDMILTYRQYGISRATFLRFLLNQAAKGTIIWRTNDLADTLYQVFLMAENLHKIRDPTPTLKIAMAEWFLLFPGVGAKKLEKLRAQYNTPLEALKSIESWIPKEMKKEVEMW